MSLGIASGMSMSKILVSSSLGGTASYLHTLILEILGGDGILSLQVEGM
jgi:hypothetical protein